MKDIELKLTPAGRGSFFIDTDGTRVAEMEIAIQAKNLIVYHTEVSEELQGKGIASNLLAKMVEYARENKLKVVPLCTYVLAQFKRHPEQYKDIWNTEWHG
jgi:predicted GNAT family acetyltransferase